MGTQSVQAATQLCVVSHAAYPCMQWSPGRQRRWGRRTGALDLAVHTTVHTLALPAYGALSVAHADVGIVFLDVAASLALPPAGCHARRLRSRNGQ